VDPSPLDLVRPLLRTRQIREFTDEPLSDAQLDALADVARWSGSSQNTQPWRFIVVRDRAALRHLFEVGQPQTRSLETAAAAIVITVPDEEGKRVSLAYDEGRAAERILVAASLLRLGAGIAWVRGAVLPAVREAIGLPADRAVRTIVALGHPTDAAKQPKSAPGEARLPREQVVFEERWPEG
jgi:nitroreductase